MEKTPELPKAGQKLFVAVKSKDNRDGCWVFKPSPIKGRFIIVDPEAYVVEPTRTYAQKTLDDLTTREFHSWVETF